MQHSCLPDSQRAIRAGSTALAGTGGPTRNCCGVQELPVLAGSGLLARAGIPSPGAPCMCRSEFEGLLEKGPSEANAYLEDPAK